MLVAMDFRPHRLKETMDIEVCEKELVSIYTYLGLARHALLPATLRVRDSQHG